MTNSIKNIGSFVARVESEAGAGVEAQFRMTASAAVAFVLLIADGGDANDMKALREDIRDAAKRGLDLKDTKQAGAEYATLGLAVAKHCGAIKSAVIGAASEDDALAFVLAEMRLLCEQAGVRRSIRSLQGLLGKRNKPAKKSASKFDRAIKAITSLATADDESVDGAQFKTLLTAVMKCNGDAPALIRAFLQEREESIAASIAAQEVRTALRRKLQEEAGIKIAA